jgi:phage FluMu protein Com
MKMVQPERLNGGDVEKLNEKALKIRCEKCGRLLGNFENAKGEVKCPRCKHVQKIDLKTNDE